jgi:hypothetical protein
VHHAPHRWRKQGKPTSTDFSAPTGCIHCQRLQTSASGTASALTARRAVSVPSFSSGFQQRHDRRTTRLFASDFRSAVEAASSAGVDTLVGTEALWSVEATRGAAAFLRFTEREVVRLLEPPDPLERDVWRSSDFPNSGANRVLNLRFEVIDQPWLRKRRQAVAQASPGHWNQVEHGARQPGSDAPLLGVPGDERPGGSVDGRPGSKPAGGLPGLVRRPPGGGRDSSQGGWRSAAVLRRLPTQRLVAPSTCNGVDRAG